ncbi:class I SAM-dependent methyltransferase [Paraflavisolibacter sp. H34]|uniref:class I SAM-dependent methyltransferase n=1 Tax=Huijunlia imazamoxiresistens TaxID=3127457 RepID=UPI0030163839
MNGYVHHTHCPVCGNSEINPLLTVKDFSVSGKEFVVWQCAACSLRFTQDAPDEASIGPYYKSPDYISHTNTSKGMINKAYQAVRNYTLKQKQQLIVSQTGVQTGAILDVGCGTGAFLAVMKKGGWKTEGIELDSDARRLARELNGIVAREPSVMAQLPAGSFDAITLWHVLEHVHDLHPYVERLKELLKKGGKIFIAVPNYQSLDAGIYRPYWAAYDVPRHLYHFSPRSVEVLLQKHGLKLTAKKPMWFDSFYIALLSSKYRFGSTRWISALFNGLRSNLTAATNKDKCSSLIYVVEKA